MKLGATLRSVWRAWPGPYTSPKELHVYDSRLRYAQLFALAIVAAFVLVQMLLLHKDSLFESPVGSVNVWSRFADLPPLAPNTPLPFFCSNPLYDFKPTGIDFEIAGGLTAVNSTCPQLNVASLTSLTTTSISVPTWISRVGINFSCADGSEIGSCAPREGERVNFFNSRVAEVPVNAIHSFTTTFGLKESNVQSRLLRSDGSIFRINPKGTPLIGLTIQDYLDLAGVDLDRRNEQGYLTGVDDPFYRLTGIVLLAKIRYTNKRMWERESEPRADVTVEAVKQAWGYSGSALHWLDYPRVALREDFCAVQLRFVIEGSLGAVDFFTVILSIMAGAFLINVARMAVDFFAQHCIAREDRQAFVAAKFSAPLELNRQYTGARHTPDTRQKSRSAHKYLKKKSLASSHHEQQFAASMHHMDGTAEEEEEQQQMYRMRPGAKSTVVRVARTAGTAAVATGAFAATAAATSPSSPVVAHDSASPLDSPSAVAHPFAVPTGESDTLSHEERGQQQRTGAPNGAGTRSHSSRILPQHNPSRTPSDGGAGGGTAALISPEPADEQQRLLPTAAAHAESSSSSPISAPAAASSSAAAASPSPAPESVVVRVANSNLHES